ncbi:NAD(P)/FAD-dependent oxidoreductase [Rhodohalobacter barkolensis]|uniref:FAD-dependent oxidoreductase n=1 Tax=Rhodohalobacter barkolensis TaxID=2053187 RepID=A0A2N0VFT1_9BACT|nr:FAD-dependent oxidoreductase [Rhodohalobacter barkolensis]PKD43046.1 FAD-dependent oxidoreductase [Rhodohalobacter barkolensis]
MKREFSFWEREEWLKSPDLLVVGAGIVGASAALFYKEKNPDHDVIVVDKGFAPEGASTRNAGFACVGSVSEHLADLEIAGEETVMNRIERRWNGLKRLKSTMGEEAIGYESVGGHEIFTDDQLFEQCRNKVNWLNQKLAEKIGEAEVYSVKEFEGYPAIFNRLEGAINSGLLMRSLHQKLAEAGVRVLWNSKVSSVEPNRVEFEEGVVLTPKKILSAVNGFTSNIIDKPIQPARGFVIVTEPIEDFKWRGTFHHDRGYVYFRNVGDRLLLGGARNLAKEEETTDQFGVNPKIKEYLYGFANDVLKLPSNWKVDIEWSGIMGMTENKEPILEQVESGLFVAAGLSGMGIAVGMEVASQAVNLIEND